MNDCSKFFDKINKDEPLYNISFIPWKTIAQQNQTNTPIMLQISDIYNSLNEKCPIITREKNIPNYTFISPEQLVQNYITDQTFRRIDNISQEIQEKAEETETKISPIRKTRKTRHEKTENVVEEEPASKKRAPRRSGSTQTIPVAPVEVDEKNNVELYSQQNLVQIEQHTADTQQEKFDKAIQETIQETSSIEVVSVSKQNDYERKISEISNLPYAELKEKVLAVFEENKELYRITDNSQIKQIIIETLSTKEKTNYEVRDNDILDVVAREMIRYDIDINKEIEPSQSFDISMDDFMTEEEFKQKEASAQQDEEEETEEDEEEGEDEEKGEDEEEDDEEEQQPFNWDEFVNGLIDEEIQVSIERDAKLSTSKTKEKIYKNVRAQITSKEKELGEQNYVKAKDINERIAARL